MPLARSLELGRFSIFCHRLDTKLNIKKLYCSEIHLFTDKSFCKIYLSACKKLINRGLDDGEVKTKSKISIGTSRHYEGMLRRGVQHQNVEILLGILLHTSSSSIC